MRSGFIVIGFSAWFASLLMGEEVWRGTFESKNWPKEWGVQKSRQFGFERVSVVRSPSEESFLRVFFPKGSATNSLAAKHGSPRGGAQFLTVVPTFPEGGVQRRNSFLLSSL